MKRSFSLGTVVMTVVMVAGYQSYATNICCAQAVGQSVNKAINSAYNGKIFQAKLEKSENSFIYSIKNKV